MTSALVHGGNDVANCIGPFVVINLVFQVFSVVKIFGNLEIGVQQSNHLIYLKFFSFLFLTLIKLKY